MDALAFVHEAEALGLLSDTPPRVAIAVSILPRRGKKAARAKRQKAGK